MLHVLPSWNRSPKFSSVFVCVETTQRAHTYISVFSLQPLWSIQVQDSQQLPLRRFFTTYISVRRRFQTSFKENQHTTFTAPACKFSGLKKMHTFMQENSIFDGLITNLLSTLCILIEVLSRAHAKEGSRNDFKSGTSTNCFLSDGAACTAVNGLISFRMTSDNHSDAYGNSHMACE